jgi:hypothetical protein
MSARLRLSDEDRKRFGCEEWLEITLRPSAREAAEMQRPFFVDTDGERKGFADPDEWHEALDGTPVFDEYGAPVMVEADEEQPDGSTKKVEKQKRQTHFGALLALAWLALKRAKIDVPDLRDFDFDSGLSRYLILPDEDPESPGKGSGSDPETTSSE